MGYAGRYGILVGCPRRFDAEIFFVLVNSVPGNRPGAGILFKVHTGIPRVVCSTNVILLLDYYL